LSLNNLNSKSLYIDSLNDTINSIHLINISNDNSIEKIKSKTNQFDFYLKLLIFKIFLLFKLNKIDESIDDIKSYLDIDNLDNIYTPEVYSLYSTITNDNSLLKKAFDLDSNQRLIKSPNDKLFILIYSIFNNSFFEKRKKFSF
jgi:hypothetical protein